jgi:hypothetical protein
MSLHASNNKQAKDCKKKSKESTEYISKNRIYRKYTLGFEAFDCRQARKIGEDVMKLDTQSEKDRPFFNSRLVIANVTSISTCKEGSCLLVLV